MPKKIKQKQKQRQKQSVIVNVNLAKSSRKSSNKQINKSNKQNLPAPVHKVYTSPIHDLTPQIFSNGKQITQPSLAEQINAYLLTIGQGQPTNVNQPTNVLGQKSLLTPIPNVNVLGQKPLEIKKDFFIPKRIDSDYPIKKNIDYYPIINKPRGRPPGSKNKPKPTNELQYSEKISTPFDKVNKTYLREDKNTQTDQNIFTSPKNPNKSIYDISKELSASDIETSDIPMSDIRTSDIETEFSYVEPIIKKKQKKLKIVNSDDQTVTDDS